MGVIHLGRLIEGSEDGWFEFRGEQGDVLRRPGRIGVRVQRLGGVVSDLEITGGAVPMLEGRIWL